MASSQAVPDGHGESFVRARDLVLKYGWNTTCFQIVNPGIDHWFSYEPEAVVGYFSSKHTRVVAGAPVCSHAELATVTKQFEKDAAANNQSVCYFGAEARLDDLLRGDTEHSYVLLGAQPVWEPADWETIVASHSSLRYQLNRARNKGVIVSEWPWTKAHDNAEMRSCLEEWLTSKGLPPLHFVVEPDTLSRLEYRRIFVAEHKGQLVGFLIMSPIPERSGWLTEQFPHRRDAPNGTVELMMDAAFRTLAADGCKYITLGLSPLSRRAKIEPFDNPIWLRTLLAWMRKHGQRFYNFEGLDRFKSKLIPDRWEPVFAISNEAEFSGRTLFSIGLAFSQNHPYRLIAGGLSKSLTTEARNLYKWIARHVGS